MFQRNSFVLTSCLSFLLLLTLMRFCHSQYQSVEQVMFARRVVNEIDLREYNESLDTNRNKTVEEINKYLKNNPDVKDMLEEEKAEYVEGEEKALNESRHIERLISGHIAPFLFERCKQSYSSNHRLMFNVSLCYDVGNHSIVPYNTPADKIRVAYMKLQDYINRMTQWTRKLIRGGGFTLKKVERDTYCNVMFRSKYANSIKNARRLTVFEQNLLDSVDACLANVSTTFAPHFKLVEDALMRDGVNPKYVPLESELLEHFIQNCNLYQNVRDHYWNQLLMDPSNVGYRKHFRSYINETRRVLREEKGKLS